MRRKINLLGLRYVILWLNIICCVFMSSVIFASSRLACVTGRSAELLYSVKNVPENPEKLFFYTVLLCFAMFFTFVMRQFSARHVRIVTAFTLYVDAILNIVIVFVTDFNTNGFILWTLANIIYHIKSNRKFLVMTLGSFIYILCNYDLMSVYIPLFSVRNYFLFYERNVQQRLFFIYYMMHNFIFLFFVIFCIEVIRRQKSTIDEIRNLYSKLRIANNELREFADIKERMGETRERNRLAMEIHDTVGHSLTGISVGVDTCIAIMDVNPSAAKNQLKVISGVAKEGIADIRRSVRALQDSGNASPLGNQIQDMLEKTRRATGIVIRYRNQMSLSGLNEDEGNTIFRVVQESITNAIRHGHASEIDIQISGYEKGLVIIISDNGIGCEKFEGGFGTIHMKERVGMLGGTVDFYPQDGFTVKAVIPLRNSMIREEF
ncbi:MAG: sensor histidine kinase [Treponema sp.]|nr:sensor histidine kinase [Treponema sp.]